MGCIGEEHSITQIHVNHLLSYYPVMDYDRVSFELLLLITLPAQCQASVPVSNMQATHYIMVNVNKSADDIRRDHFFAQTQKEIMFSLHSHNSITMYTDIV